MQINPKYKIILAFYLTKYCVTNLRFCRKYLITQFERRLFKSQHHVIYLFIYWLCFLVDCFILSKTVFLKNYYYYLLFFARFSCAQEEKRRPSETALYPFCTEKQTKKNKPRLAITVCRYLLSEFLGNTWLHRSVFSLYESVESRLKCTTTLGAFGDLWSGFPGAALTVLSVRTHRWIQRHEAAVKQCYRSFLLRWSVKVCVQRLFSLLWSQYFEQPLSLSLLSWSPEGSLLNALLD